MQIRKVHISLEGTSVNNLFSVLNSQEGEEGSVGEIEDEEVKSSKIRSGNERHGRVVRVSLGANNSNKQFTSLQEWK